jgi:hypothetical protein
VGLAEQRFNGEDMLHSLVHFLPGITGEVSDYEASRDNNTFTTNMGKVL